MDHMVVNTFRGYKFETPIVGSTLDWNPNIFEGSYKLKG